MQKRQLYRSSYFFDAFLFGIAACHLCWRELIYKIESKPKMHGSGSTLPSHNGRFRCWRKEPKRFAQVPQCRRVSKRKHACTCARNKEKGASCWVRRDGCWLFFIFFGTMRINWLCRILKITIFICFKALPATSCILDLLLFCRFVLYICKCVWHRECFVNLQCVRNVSHNAYNLYMWCTFVSRLLKHTTICLGHWLQRKVPFVAHPYTHLCLCHISYTVHGC